jgi:hypothetical protein
MQTIKFLSTICLSLMVSTSFAQIKMDSNGKVGLGTSAPDPSFNTTIQGSLLIRNPGNYLQITPSSIIPSSAYSFNLGSLIVPLNEGHFRTLSCSEDAFFTCITHFDFDTYFSWMYADDINCNDLTCYGTFTDYSDKRLKNNIKTLPFDRSLFSRLNPVSFDISDSLLIEKRGKKSGEKARVISEYGFLAQDLQEVYPQLVVKDDSTGFLKIKPLEFIPILVKALHDQQAQLEAQQVQINTLEAAISKQNGKSKSATMDDNGGINLPCKLYQNVPNPFSANTLIKYSLSNEIATASLMIFDMQGKLIRTIPINGKGEGSVTIEGSSLTPGMYIYTLIANGNEVDTKRMILTK